jgi:ribosomal-protein-alanine N-acetyltransferase
MTGPPLRAAPPDAEAMAELHALAFAAPERWNAATFANQLALPGVFGFLCPGAGFVLARVAADEAEILTIAVAPEARRAGLGGTLLRAAERQAAAGGARKMLLEVAPANLAGRALYAMAGYADVGRRRKYYPDGSDALVLGRALTPAATTAG